MLKWYQKEIKKKKKCEHLDSNEKGDCAVEVY